MTFALNAEQQAAVAQVLAWAESSNPNRFVLAGLAGTGKTTIVKHLLETRKDLFRAVLAPTGKAAYVLQQKGVAATTIHRFCYTLAGESAKGPEFDFVGILKGRGVIVVDEASMIDSRVLGDLLHSGARFLLVGDHGQLPPVGHDPGIMRTPNVRLETICRQAQGDPILTLAHAVRKGAHPHSFLGQGIVKRAEEHEDGPESATVLVGSNEARCNLNRQMRQTCALDQGIEKVLVLRNDYGQELFNGQVLDVEVRERDDHGHPVSGIYDGHRIWFWDQGWLQPKPDFQDFDRGSGLIAADYGYALTVHKAQGSEWDRVEVLEDCTPGGDANRWRYTAITRAKKHLTYLLP